MGVPSVLFVCTGNICRSPVAEVICSKYTKGSIKTDSAGISNHHVNEQADERVFEIVSQHGIDISKHRARQIRADDWMLFDYIVALDQKVYDVLLNMRPNTSISKVVLYGNIRDPYFCGRTGFHKMYEEIETVMPKFLESNKIYNMS
ncbi:low molecular weight phosphotyrosine protein phosphatase, putative [Trichomonas vaginalis G3]|uniref:Low molecular weight phosphotyrosine protein phosphatase, putative n=1 Tax=Trichomonas vaginalis (strain ATCC PRA-98 / G3) TaxID=412133 RepID=A2ENR8_TRIV3|nr:non-membrane spanning protein tyrosine phosphatase protein [Trichomonas vaginalis G3]EAY05694.1 low molecular weight phosphotyrosine protein phosphatase, putative [Trichomonas vaginalis G3]KAI5506874.1 non-membrane spanning protein tyrosine phosphatase protein [Trichomonas vaginalis G3]|eukprot:XP_001317917.1 low molecular weight phosphotyrosine protein phosphatase [Trichomonas vaginalis G3]